MSNDVISSVRKGARSVGAGTNGVTPIRLPPHDIEAEACLLSCCMIDEGKTLAKARAEISPASFFDTKHEIVFRILCQMADDGKPIEIDTLDAELKHAGKFQAVGGHAFVVQISKYVPTTAQASFWIDSVRVYAARRRAIRIAEGFIEDAHNAKETEEFAACVEQRSASIAELGAGVPGLLKSKFPALESEPEEAEILPEVEPLIGGILEPGDKLSLSSGSKSFKTWSLIQLGLSVATGSPWLGFPTSKRRVLFLNFEIKSRSLWRRVYQVRRAMGLAKVEDFIVWNLRGRGFNLDSHANELIKRAKESGADVIILDPIYKLFGDRNENSAGDMATLMAIFDRVAVESGAAILFSHHFAKGSPELKDPMDRSSGSGVFARDPDCIVTLTRLDESEGQDVFAVSMTLREFPPVPDFAIRRDHPLMIRCDGPNVRNLHAPNRRQAKYSAQQLVDLLPEGGLSTTGWQRLAHERFGMSRSTFYDYADAAKRLARSEGNLWFPSAPKSDKSDKSDLGIPDRRTKSESDYSKSDSGPDLSQSD